MEELASVNWLLEQTKRQFQIFDLTNLDSTDDKPVNKKQRPEKLSNSLKPINGAKRSKRPRESLAVLIYQAMQHYQRKLTVAEISDFISDKYTYYRLRKHWTITGTIRNALSKDARFRKIGRTQKENKRGCFWLLECEPLWDKILSGKAPIINSETDFRFELQKLCSHETGSSLSDSSDSFEHFYEPMEESVWTDSANFDCLEFEDFEKFVKDLDDKHPWQVDDDQSEMFSNEWNDWIY